MRYVTCILISCFCFCTDIVAQPGHVYGSVLSKEQASDTLTISVFRGNRRIVAVKQTFDDFDLQLPAGCYTMVFSRKGFIQVAISGVELTPGKYQSLDTWLVKSNANEKVGYTVQQNDSFLRCFVTFRNMDELIKQRYQELTLMEILPLK